MAAKRTKKVDTPAETVVAYKGFDKDLKCRDYQFEVGKTYEHTGNVVACERGFHACENPFDVWGYYGLGEGNRFARVTLSGELSRHGGNSKIAAGRITVDAELRLPDFIAAAVKWVIDATKGKGDNPSGYSAQIGSSGDYAQIGSSGHYAKIGSSGYSAQIGSSGHYAKIGSSGYSAQIGSSGDYAKIGSSGYSAQIGSSGDYAKIGSSGYYAQIEASGKSAVIACAGVGSAVSAGEDGAICIPWHDGKRTRFAVGYVGEDGIEAGVLYRAEAGKLVAVKP
jgi:hypothetical protein